MLNDIETALQAKIRQGMVERARSFALADRSDPFTFARCIAHINSGAASPTRVEKPFTEGDYAASRFEEPAWYKGKDGGVINYSVPAYRNLARP